MRIAIISDIHGNLEALQAVSSDIERSDADAILCLGDSIGYGPNPAECLDWVRAHCFSLLGNAEEAALFAPSAGGEASSPMMAWTRARLGLPDQLPPRQPSAAQLATAQLATGQSPRNLVAAPDPIRAGGDSGSDADSTPGGTHAGLERRLFLESLPRVGWRGEALLVHASPRNPLHEYLLPSCVDAESAFETLFQLIPRWAFVGHTHVAGVFTDQRRFLSAAECPRFVLAGHKAIVNVGSVGQPRDGDPRACYVLWQRDQVDFRRVEYDMAGFLAKSRLHPELASSQTASWFPAAT
ncbi:MAG: metallophosphoesterase family protein [Planctomycetota bacterium]